MNNNKALIIDDSEQVSDKNIPAVDIAVLKKTRSLLFIIAILGVILDQVTKYWVTNNFNMFRPVNIIGSYLRLVLVHNDGMIWGIPIKSTITYYILPIIGIIFILFIGYKNRSTFKSIAYGLIIGGAIGNLIDRIHLGYVIDFIDMGYKNLRWATYNFADFSIVVGIVMVITSGIFIRNGFRIIKPVSGKGKKSPNA